jgi:L-asparaginase II
VTATPLAHVVRSGFVESVHYGSVVVLAADGSVLTSVGDPTAPVYARSSNKPMQATGMVEAGLDLYGDLLALSSASHSGEPFHLDGVQRILAGAGLTVADLQNTPDRPIDEDERTAWILAGRAPSSLGQNCSGKHAAMLATCVAAGWDTATYRDPEHPLQRHLTATIERLAGERVVSTGVDGCGAPVVAFSLTGLARAFAAIAVADAGTPAGRVAAAIRSAPQFLGGTHRDVTALLRDVPGLIAKDGAEAVYAAALPDGRAVAVKIADGGGRARTVVMAEALAAAGVPREQLTALAGDVVLGHGDPVGAVVGLPLT